MTDEFVNSDSAEVKVVIITSDDQVVLTFNNPASEVNSKQNNVSKEYNLVKVCTHCFAKYLFLDHKDL